MNFKHLVIVDIDGTVALRGERGPFDWDRVGEDAPNWPVLNIINTLSISGVYEFIFLTGRMEQCKLETKMWLAKYFIGSIVDNLHMRPDDDYSPDDELKLRLYKEHIEGKYNVAAVFDDRNKVVAMWRRLGLTVLQVADGDF